MKINIPLITLMAILAVPSTHAGEKYCEWDVKDFAIKQPLCGLTGNAERGRNLAIDRKKGNCLACHQMPIPEQDFHGELGPNLAGVGARYTSGMIRLRIVDEKKVNPATLMPGFYVDPASLRKVAKKFQGKTPLSAQEVEDIVAYLSTLK